jgi:prepilin-type N-terminal cleavage/methylation domain-containing protein
MSADRLKKRAVSATARMTFLGSGRLPIPGSNHGFTLMELLLVLTILGFLMVMTAPRLASVTTEGVETGTRMNMSELLDFLTIHRQKTGKFPSGMINTVSVDGNTGVYHKPILSDQDPETGPEVLATTMDEHHRFFIHYLNGAEATELRELGVVTVNNYNSSFDRDVAVGMPHMQPVEAGRGRRAHDRRRGFR